MATTRNAASDEDEDGDEDAEATDDAAAGDDDESAPINVIYVADVDVLFNAFMRIRARPDDESQIQWKMDNVTFLLNIIDDLTGDDAYIPIRKRKLRHPTLRAVEKQSEYARRLEIEKGRDFEASRKEAQEEAQKKMDEALKTFMTAANKFEEKQRAGEQVNPQERDAAQRALAEATTVQQRRFNLESQRLQRDFDTKIEKIKRDTDLQIEKVQNEYKRWAVILPPILPLTIGFVVFVRRRLREREGISRSRIK